MLLKNSILFPLKRDHFTSVIQYYFHETTCKEKFKTFFIEGFTYDGNIKTLFETEASTSLITCIFLTLSRSIFHSIT
jgi:hypothetical protein